MKRWMSILIAVAVSTLTGGGLLAHSWPAGHSSSSAQTPPAHGPPQHPVAASQIEVVVLQGSTDAGGIEGNLSTRFPQLTHPPFSAYPHITHVQDTAHVALGSPGSTVSFPGGTAEIALVSVQPNGRFQMRVHLTVDGRGHDVVFSAGLNDPFFTVHQTHSGSTALILGFIVQ